MGFSRVFGAPARAPNIVSEKAEAKASAFSQGRRGPEGTEESLLAGPLTRSRSSGAESPRGDSATTYVCSGTPLRGPRTFLAGVLLEEDPRSSLLQTPPRESYGLPRRRAPEPKGSGAFPYEGGVSPPSRVPGPKGPGTFLGDSGGISSGPKAGGFGATT